MSSKLILETVLERKYSKTWLARPTFVLIKSGRISEVGLDSEFAREKKPHYKHCALESNDH